MALGRNFVRQYAHAALDLVFPPLCLGCMIEIDAHGALCPDCWRKLTFIEGSLCQQCGLPFDAPLGDDVLCAACIADPPEFAAARAVLVYDDASRNLVLPLKHADRLEGAAAYAGWMRRVARSLPAEPDVIAAVPLHWTRLFRRRYNQAAVLSRALSRELQVPHVPDLLDRRRRTPSQGGLSREARRRNVQGAFAVRPRHLAGLAGKTVLLVDDVMTTGATLNACARVLRRTGAASVLALALCRAV